MQISALYPYQLCHYFQLCSPKLFCPILTTHYVLRTTHYLLACGTSAMGVSCTKWSAQLRYVYSSGVAAIVYSSGVAAIVYSSGVAAVVYSSGMAAVVCIAVA